MRRRLLLSVAVAIGIFSQLTGCGSSVGPTSPVVGGVCGSHDHCAVGSYCELGGDFPGGMCTMHCDRANGCPAGAFCIEKKGGICLPACQLHTECRAGYKCDDKDLIDKTGKVFVCVKD